ncbi:hypothetical protein PHMEG_0001005 [Phytophthora megakarya]|uniref:Uncharacterized protein n=1 Tax=Phytophthora megakarya TaxID=4795 RepID=A0A225X2Q3_9STRA|nr:hypothetical protein PHMEG_0001005 [Phytophthora megakarya]
MTQISQQLAQTAQTQQQNSTDPVSSKPSRKKSDPPRFQGNNSDDLELWIFSTEQCYVEFES